MWICTKCGERIEAQFDSCWKCSTPKTDGASTSAVATFVEEAKAAKWRLAYRVFRSTFSTWDVLFDQAATFATEIGPERFVSISHSADDCDGVVTVWYWTTEEAAPVN
jgi:hypothetical protein